MLQPQIFADHAAVSEHAADWMADRLRRRPDLLTCLATGATPMRCYELLADRVASVPSLFDRVRVLKLDEWGGIAMDDPSSCEQYLRQALVTPLGLEARYVSFDSQVAKPQAECARVAAWLAQHGPIDVCVLGLGVNGHLGFNEPADELQPHAHVAELSSTTLAHAMVSDTERRPTFGLTLGMADLLQSREVLLLVTGAGKQAPLARLLSGRITTDFPASMLWLHPSVTLLCDEAACPRA